MRKVQFLIVLNKGTYASNATIGVNASLCIVLSFSYLSMPNKTKFCPLMIEIVFRLDTSSLQYA